jgi:hypothetical protein
MEAKPFNKRRRIRIATVPAICSEIGRVYAAAVRGELLWADATRACYCLKIKADLHQGALFDERLSVIEARLAEQGASGGARANGGYEARYARP